MNDKPEVLNVIKEKISNKIPLNKDETLVLMFCVVFAVDTACKYVLHDLFGIPLPDNKKDDQ